MTSPGYEMLRFLARCDDACRRAKVKPHDFWGTHGMGGSRVSKSLANRGLVCLGWTSDGYAGAKITPEGREALANEKEDRNEDDHHTDTQ